jgi:hypothetical protein
MTTPRRLLGGAVAVGAAVALAAASAVPVRVHPAGEARLRVAFSARPERVETCRTLGAGELAAVPEHMRQSVVCEGSTARYRLDVRHGDSLLATAVVRGGGLRHDRQLYVLRELPVPSGRATIEVRLSRLDSARAPAGAGATPGAAAGPRPRDAEERRRRMADEVPASLVLRESVTLAPREVLLVTYDQEARRLHAVRGAR